MAGTFLTGPSVVAGPLAGNGSGSFPQEYSVEFGPSLEYQGDGILDVRFAPINKDNPQPGSIPSHFNAPYFLEVDAVPSASAATAVNIAAAQNVTSGTPLTLVSAASSGISLSIPLVQVSTGNVVTPALMLDFGWGTISVTSGSATATPQSGTIGYYQLGQWVVIGQALTATTPLIAQVLAIGTSTITLSQAAGNTNASAPVGSANILSYLSGATATAHVPAVAAGLARMWDPQQCLTRGVAISGSTSATGGAFLVSGYDLYGAPQTETITHGGGATNKYGNKTWKGIVSITPQFTDAHNYSAGTSDLIGFTTRSDRYEATNLYWNGAFLTSAVSTAGAWTAADTTSPATATTGDVRGTFQVSSRGPNATVTATTFCDGTKRVAIYLSVNLYNMIAATPQNTVPMYGVVPA